MNYFKHTGLYVDNLLLMTKFYKETFDLIPICENEPDAGRLYEELYGMPDAKVTITKLISEYGKVTGQGDMLELIQLCLEKRQECFDVGGKKKRIYQTGMAHVAIGVDDIDNIIKKLKLNGGSALTEILTKGERKCCFCTDPEGNFIEVIE